jgi:hypothetical protein
MEIGAIPMPRQNAEFAVIYVIMGVKLHEKGQLSFWVAQKGAVFNGRGLAASRIAAREIW